MKFRTNNFIDRRPSFQMSINIIQKAFTQNRKESVSRHDSSPVKTVLGKKKGVQVYHLLE